MKQFYVYASERWPDYRLDDPDEDEPEYNITLTDAELADYERVRREYEEWQTRFGAFKDSLG